MRENKLEQFFASNSLWIAILIIFAFAAQAILLQSNLLLNSDVSFLTQMALNTTEADFYTQYYEINPPLIIYIYKVFLVFYHLNFLDEISSLRASMTVLILFVSFINLYILRETRYGVLIAIVFSFSLYFVYPLNFLQREHIIATCFTLYFSQVYSILVGNKTSLTFKVFSYTLLALALCLKPQYLLVVLFVEGYLILLTRRLRLLFRPELIVTGIFGLCYLAFVFTKHNQYFELIAPIASSTYQSYFINKVDLFFSGLFLLVVAYLPFSFLKKSEHISRHYSNLMLIITFSGILAFWVGQTGFSYHLFTAVTFLTSLMIVSLICSLLDLATHRRLTNLLPVIFFVTFIILLNKNNFWRFSVPSYASGLNTLIDSQTRNFPENTPVRVKSLYNAITTHTTVGQDIMFFSTTMHPAHSTSLYSGLNWVGSFPVLWPLPYALNNPGDPISSEVSAFVMSTIIKDITKRKPHLIVIETSDELRRYPAHFSFKAYLNSDSSAAMAFSNYALVADSVHKEMKFELYRRKVE
ncbi:hypothetical protein [Vibrio sp. 10N.261.55.A7]|uniref:hypothetical protein n=1 Tax=Vibrio sp. 10N.261.55.A7 TaxID=1880851 RepID=UPI000C82008E|nr:hypothetical protein [Vibrio sp. 10N.261.55.A7]PMJ99274.1 hypothetical protein BCU12_21110 [Vibrio sp. 10N.261.55.A7]